VICALCRTDGALCRSHIIPEFLYRAMYDEKHRMHVLSASSLVRDRMAQSGLWEYLLCQRCESRLSRWERYGANVLEGGIELQVRREGAAVHVSGLDYASFRLFQLSILWRASVSSLPFFRKVDLGRHTELIRALLIAGTPGRHLQYGCLMFGLKFMSGSLNGVVVQPTVQRLQGQRAFRFVFGGFLWVYLVANHDIAAPLSLGILTPKGDLTFLVKDARELRDLQSFADARSALGRSKSNHGL
jgi:hypothetical protein